MQSKIAEELFPPTIKSNYTNFQLIAESTYFHLYEAKARSDGFQYTIRVLNTNSKFAKENYNHATTLFLQEILRFSMKFNQTDAIIIENFDFYEGKIGFVTKPYYPLQTNQQSKNLPADIDIKKLIKEVVSDINFLHSRMKLGNIQLDPKSIYLARNTDIFFLSDWANSTKLQASTQLPSESSTIKIGPDIQSNATTEIYALGLTALSLSGVSPEKIEDLIKIKDTEIYNSALHTIVSNLGTLKQPEPVQKIILRMLEKESDSRVKIDELLEPYGALSELRVAWCSWGSNTISILDMQGNRINDSYQGAQLKGGGLHTFIEQMPNYNYLISLNISERRFANFEVFDTSAAMHCVFNLQEIQGLVTGDGIACNAKRGLAALISVKDEIAYHLFDCSLLKVKKKAKWQFLHKHVIRNMDFNVDGRKIATIDENGVLLVAETDMENYLFHILTMEGEKTFWSHRCQWNPLIDLPFIAAKYNKNLLSLIDAEKQLKVNKEAINLDDKGEILWINWRNDGNLIACGGTSHGVKIYDRRTSAVVKSFDNLHTGSVFSVKWSPRGNMLATASNDSTMKVIGFNSGKVIYSGETADAKSANSVCFLDAYFAS